MDRVLLWVVVTVRPGPRRPVREAAALAGEAVSAEVLPEAEASAAAEALEAVPEAGAVSEAAPEAEASEEAREAEAASGAVPEAAASEEKLVKAVCPGNIYLLHAVSSTNAQIMGSFIDRVRDAGFTWGDPGTL